jgi:acid phosphatase
LVVVMMTLSMAWMPPAAHALSGKVVVIVMENEAYTSIVGSSHAPYINSLIAQGELFTNYTAVVSGSQHNYLAMTSGLTAKVSPPPNNIFQAIDATAGAVTWKGFQESMTGTCGAGSAGKVPGKSTQLYGKPHDPATKYGNASCTTNDISMTATNFMPAALPDFSYIIPNYCDDMHTLPTGGQPCPAYFGSNPGTSVIGMGDAWLSAVVPQLLAQPNVTVILTWDEGKKSSGERIVTLEVGAGITPGSTDGTAYTHYGLLAGLFSVFGLGTPPNNAATATPLPIP